MSDLRNRATPATYTRAEAEAPNAYLQQRDSWRQSRDRSHDKISPHLRNVDYLWQRLDALTCALTQPCVVLWEAPAVLTSAGNKKDISVAAMHARRSSVKAKREMGERIAREFNTGFWLARARAEFYVVVLTRIAPRRLDSDNLETAFKAVRDGIADGLRIDDRDAFVRYVVSQEQGAPRHCAVRAELFVQLRGALTRNEVSQESPNGDV